MPRIQFRALLQAESFPLVAVNSPRTVIVGKNDIRPQPSPTEPVEAERAERQLPATIYLENTMATAQGMSSVTYDELTPSIGAVKLTQQFEVRNDSGGRWRLGVGQNELYVFDADNPIAWQKLTLHPELLNADWVAKTFTYAYVLGTTYFYLDSVGCFEIDLSNFLTTSVLLTGLEASKINGICSASNYLLAYDKSTVYWSAAENPLDFIPDTETGADSLVPNDLRGRITCVLPIPQGFIVYTSGNAIAATYTNNLEFPWVFREVQGSSGVTSAEQVSADENFAEHVVWSTAGLQQVGRQEAKLIFAEITDFLSGRTLDIPNTENKVTPTYADGSYYADGDIYADGYLSGDAFAVPVTEYLPYDFRIKIQLVGARYLVISYGEFELTQALVYDYAIKRWGKLNITHVDVFEFAATYNSGTLPWRGLKRVMWSKLSGLSWQQLDNFQRQQGVPRHNLAFLLEDGRIVTVNLDDSAEDRSGVMMLGRFQLQRGDWITLEEVWINQVFAQDDFKVYVVPSYDGITYDEPVELTEYRGSGNSRVYLSSVTAYNLTVVLVGAYSALDCQLVFAPNGTY